jgi:hypothetical protein
MERTGARHSLRRPSSLSASAPSSPRLVLETNGSRLLVGLGQHGACTERDGDRDSVPPLTGWPPHGPGALNYLRDRYQFNLPPARPARPRHRHRKNLIALIVCGIQARHRLFPRLVNRGLERLTPDMAHSADPYPGIMCSKRDVDVLRVGVWSRRGGGGRCRLAPASWYRHPGVCPAERVQPLLPAALAVIVVCWDGCRPLGRPGGTCIHGTGRRVVPARRRRSVAAPRRRRRRGDSVQSSGCCFAAAGGGHDRAHGIFERSSGLVSASR